MEFTNFRFNPTTLKVCKIAGNACYSGNRLQLHSCVGQPDDRRCRTRAPLFPAFSQNVTVTAGPAAQGGNCTFVNGSALLGGSFNQGSTITITEAARERALFRRSTCPSCGTGGLTTDLAEQSSNA